MFEPGSLIAAVGAVSTAMAASAGVMAARAHVELVRLQSPLGAALQRFYDQVAEEPVPASMIELLEQLSD
jgi:hypothetical protein